MLDSPLLALRRLVELLADDPHNPTLRADEIVSTGTLTLTIPVSAGETWATRVHGIPLEDIAIRFECEKRAVAGHFDVRLPSRA